MAISSKKREEVIGWGISPEFLDNLEAFNQKQALGAKAAGVESKDLSEPVEEAVDPVPPVEADVQVEEEVQPDAELEKEAPVVEDAVSEPVNAELLEALENTARAVVNVGEMVKGIETAFEARISELESLVKSLARDDEEKIANKAALTPFASITEILNKSITRSEEARIDGRTKLAKEGPEEVEAEPPHVTGIPMIDKFINDGRRG